MKDLQKYKKIFVKHFYLEQSAFGEILIGVLIPQFPGRA
jgi:hypothetical protein